jgi:hypothetical protein
VYARKVERRSVGKGVGKKSLLKSPITSVNVMSCHPI